MLDALGRKSENLQPSTNNLGEIPCVFFVNIMWKTENDIPSIVFREFFNWFNIWWIFYGKMLQALWVRWWCRGWLAKNITCVSYVGGKGSPKPWICVQGEMSVQKPALGFGHTSWKTPHGNINSFRSNVFFPYFLKSLQKPFDFFDDLRGYWKET